MKKLLYISLVLLAIACSKQEIDTVKPTINVMHLSTGDSFNTGTDMHIHGVFADETALKSFHIEVGTYIAEEDDMHHEGQDHTHDHKRSSWTWDTTANISGKSHTLHYPNFTIPSTIDTGMYQIVFNCMDSSNNMADKVKVMFYVMQSDSLNNSH